MSAQVYSVPGQTEGRNKTFLERKSIDLHGVSQCLLTTCGGNVNYFKTVHQPIPTRENREHPDNFQSESVRSGFNEFCHFTLQNEITIFQPVNKNF